MLTTPRIHPNAIDLLARVFNTHKKGLPEWMKNAREAYLRLREGVPAADRHVVIHLSRAARHNSYLEVMDFVGISGADIESRYLEWANPDAASYGLKAGEAEGGQGNGGKAYLRQMFEKGYFISICDGRLSVVSFTDPKKYVLDFVPDATHGKDNAGDNPVLRDIRTYAGDWLEAYGLPRGHNITIVRGVGPLRPIDPEKLLDEIQQFPQARETIRSCSVKYWENKEELYPLTVDEPPLHAAFPKPIIVPIPEKLPLYGRNVPTAKPPVFAPGTLEIRISSKPLQGQALATWNRFDFHASGPTVLGFLEGSKLPLRFPQYGRHVYGSCTVPLLKDPADDYEMQGRVALNDGPLSSVLYQFIANEVDKQLEILAKHAQGQGAMKKRKNLEKLNQKLAQWMESKFPNISGMAETGEGTGRGKRGRKPRERKEHQKPVTLKAHRSALDICAGVVYPMRAVAYDAEQLPVPPGKVVWRSADSNIAAVHPERGDVEGRLPGITTLTVENALGLKSEPVVVTVHQPSEIRITNRPPVLVGSNRRVQLNVEVVTTKGKVVKNPAVHWRSSDTRIATVGPDGWLVGGEVGDAEVSATVKTVVSAPLEVEVEKGAAGKPRGGGKGRPQILLSGQHLCPEDNSDVLLDPGEPIIYQRPYKQDYENNIFWINLQHPMAAALLAGGEQSLQWRTYHFQRVIDVYATLLLRREFEDQTDLDVDQVLDGAQEKVTEIFAWAKEDSDLFTVLYSAELDLAAM